VFHGAFTLALAEGRDVVAALRFAAAAAGLKCTRLGGSMAAPAPRRGRSLARDALRRGSPSSYHGARS
jgi:sugar/nucleoside kinase (ribokinase family)